MTREEANAVHAAMRTAAEAVAKKHGMRVARQSGSFSDALSISITIEKVDIDERGINVASPAVADYARYAAGYGLPEDGVGRTFTERGRQYTILGLEPRARTFPIVVRRDDGSEFRLTAAVVKKALG